VGLGKAFGAQVEKVRRGVAALELPDSAGDTEALAESARLLEQATERLEEAHMELEAEMQVLEDLIEQGRLRYRDLFGGRRTPISSPTAAARSWRRTAPPRICSAIAAN